MAGILGWRKCKVAQFRRAENIDEVMALKIITGVVGFLKSCCKITCSCDDVSAYVLYFFSETMEKNMKNGKFEISERQT